MDTNDGTPPPPIDPPDSRVLRGETCRGCGYPLRGLDPAGSCPECGRSVESSLRGDLLAYASLEYLSSLRRGALILELALASSLLSLSGIIASAYVLPSLSHWVAAGFTVLGQMLYVTGWWMFSTPDPGVRKDKGERARRVVRGSAVVGAAAALISAFADILFPNSLPLGPGAAPGAAVPSSLAADLSIGAEGLSILAWAVQFFASMKYLAWLAPRFPDPALARKVKRYTWLFPVLIVFTCVIGLLIAWIALLVMFDRIRRRVAAVHAAVSKGEFPDAADAHPASSPS